MIGVLQYVPWAGSQFFIVKYTYKEAFITAGTVDVLMFRRVPGFANHATASGGYAAFFFAVSTGTFLYLKKYRLAAVICIILSILNSFVFCQARMGYVTIIFSVFLFYLLRFNIKTFFIRTFKLFLIFSLTLTLIYYLFLNNNSIIYSAMFRWESLFTQINEGENRIGQVTFALNQIDSTYKILFGLSRYSQQIITNFWIEVEPIFVFVIYGATGFILQYLFVFFLAYYFKSHMNSINIENKTLAVISFASLIGYVFFSFAFYFFREIHVGLFPWILFGASAGFIERSIKEKNINV